MKTLNLVTYILIIAVVIVTFLMADLSVTKDVVVVIVIAFGSVLCALGVATNPDV